MRPASRVVSPESLDAMSPSDPLAIRSRRDLRRVHRAMGSLRVLQDALARLELRVPPRRILELGAGDGSLTLRLARAMSPSWREVSLTLLDLHDLVGADTRAGFEALGWHCTVIEQDALEWAVAAPRSRYDLCITTLFLHHFDTVPLAVLLRGIALHSDAVIACEPRRGTLARLGSSLIGLIGANEVTRGDAVKSVAAGFRDQELTRPWLEVAGPAWHCEEYSDLPFTHCFVASLAGARDKLEG